MLSSTGAQQQKGDLGFDIGLDLGHVVGLVLGDFRLAGFEGHLGQVEALLGNLLLRLLVEDRILTDASVCVLVDVLKLER